MSTGKLQCVRSWVGVRQISTNHGASCLPTPMRCSVPDSRCSPTTPDRSKSAGWTVREVGTCDTPCFTAPNNVFFPSETIDVRLPTWEELTSVPEQLDVLEYPLDKSLFVVGPPGSGKTVLAMHRRLQPAWEIPSFSRTITEMSQRLRDWLRTFTAAVYRLPKCYARHPVSFRASFAHEISISQPLGCRIGARTVAEPSV